MALAALAMLSSPAEARHWRHYYRGYARQQAAPARDPAFAAMVVDENSGRTLYAASEDEPRHPASLTKVMTLYLLFEQLEKGRLSLDSSIVMSEHAASQAPSKLGLEPGEAITVDNAIKSIVTRSANDVAVAIGEHIAGDEASFAELMTRKAHALGMTHTTYVNASGLPDDRQITTARDLSILGRAVQERFPHYFHYFSTHSFDYAGETIGNHNHLLGRVDGVDGIKTGYTRASGFNLLTSLHRDGRSLVAVVMGGATAYARDRLMEQLIAQHFASATTAHTATMIADASTPEPAARLASVSIDRRTASAPTPPSRASFAPVARDDKDAEGDDDNVERDPPAPAAEALRSPVRREIRSLPIAVASAIPVPPLVPAHVADSSPAALGWVKGPDGVALQAAPARAPAVAAIPSPPARADNSPATLGWVKGPDPVALSAGPKAVATVLTPPVPARAPESKPIPPAKAFVAAVHPKEETRIARSEEARASEHDGWMIQIGASADAGKAGDLLSRAKAANRSTLASAKPFTEKVGSGEATFYRARFAGLDSSSAEAACRSLKRSGFSCFATHD
jgi:D-alanyl-D-alanine carboxypeptidase